MIKMTKLNRRKRAKLLKRWETRKRRKRRKRITIRKRGEKNEKKENVKGEERDGEKEREEGDRLITQRKYGLVKETICCFINCIIRFKRIIKSKVK